MSKDPDTYSEGFLGKSNAEYQCWILDSQKWGGAIELSILARWDPCTTSKEFLERKAPHDKSCRIGHEQNSGAVSCLGWKTFCLPEDHEVRQTAAVSAAFRGVQLGDMIDLGAILQAGCDTNAGSMAGKLRHMTSRQSELTFMGRRTASVSASCSFMMGSTMML